MSSPAVFTDSPPATSVVQSWVTGVVLYAGLPLVLGFWYALSQAGVFARHFPFPLAVACWVSILGPRWWCQGLATWAVHRLLARWQPSLPVLLVSGGCLGTLLCQPYAIWVAGWFQTTFGQYLPSSIAGPPLDASAAELMLRMIDTLPLQLLAIAPWVLANFACDRWLGIPRYRYDASTPRTSPTRGEDSQTSTVPSEPAPVAPGPSEVAAAALPGFASKLRRVAPHDILAIEAADHFIRVHGSAASEMIYCQFGDALQELAHGGGLRVHRSWWVRRSAVVAHGRSNGNPSLRLTSGVVVPVGRSFHSAVRAATRGSTTSNSAAP